jgi:hypothetical protein
VIITFAPRCLHNVYLKNLQLIGQPTTTTTVETSDECPPRDVTILSAMTNLKNGWKIF